jgi:hypothetical protein
MIGMIRWDSGPRSASRLDLDVHRQPGGSRLGVDGRNPEVMVGDDGVALDSRSTGPINPTEGSRGTKSHPHEKVPLRRNVMVTAQHARVQRPRQGA